LKKLFLFNLYDNDFDKCLYDYFYCFRGDGVGFDDFEGLRVEGLRVEGFLVTLKAPVLELVGEKLLPASVFFP